MSTATAAAAAAAAAAKIPARMAVIGNRKLHHPDILFAIHRSLNDNLCVYRLNRHSRTNRIDPDTPVQVYWLDVDAHSATGYRQSLLTHLEATTAYGVQVESRGAGDNNSVTFHIRALPGMAITAVMSGGGADDRGSGGQNYSRAFTQIGGAACELHTVDVQLGGLLNHRVKSVRLTGSDHTGRRHEQVVSP